MLLGAVARQPQENRNKGDLSKGVVRGANDKLSLAAYHRRMEIDLLVDAKLPHHQLIIRLEAVGSKKLNQGLPHLAVILPFLVGSAPINRESPARKDQRQELTEVCDTQRGGQELQFLQPVCEVTSPVALPD